MTAADKEFYYTLLFFFRFGGLSLVPILVFFLVLIGGSWLLATILRKYLSGEAPEVFSEQPLPLWMWAMIVITVFFPAFLAASVTPV